MTLDDKIASLKAEYPTLRVGDEESGYTDLNPDDYEATILQWANNQIAQEAKAVAEQAIIDARTSGITHALSLGFTQVQAEAMFP